jgi:transcription elongation factor Elf1
MTFTCHSCGSVNSLIRMNGSPKVFSCCGCHATYRVSVERLSPPKTDKRLVRPEEYVKAGA